MLILNAKYVAQEVASVSQVITEGVTTKTQVRESFGSPMETSHFIEGGMEIWKYRFDDTPVEAGNAWPVDHSSGASASRQSQELMILFTGKDVVSRYAMAKADVSQTTGLFR